MRAWLGLLVSCQGEIHAHGSRAVGRSHESFVETIPCAAPGRLSRNPSIGLDVPGPLDRSEPCEDRVEIAARSEGLRAAGPWPGEGCGPTGSDPADATDPCFERQ